MNASDKTTSHSTKLPAEELLAGHPKDGNQVAGYQIISNYESLSAITSQMREAAVQGEWGTLVGLEQQCGLHVATMKPIDATATLDEPARQRKIQLIRKILADDAEIRNHTEVWMGQLQRIMQSNRQEQRLQQAYGG